MNDIQNRKAVILLSGGIDSSTTLAIADSEGYDCYALSFDYSQRHRVEIDSARRVACQIGVKRHLIISFDLREIGGSALTGEMEVPKVKESGKRGEGNAEKPKSKMQETRISKFEFRNSETGIPVTYVPARNTIFLSFALGWAEVLEAEDIFIGANAVDYSGYPDCRPEYLRAFEEMANLATRVSVEGRLRFRIRAPLLYLTKGEIIKRGAGLGLDYSLTWSCYDPLPDGTPCLGCDSCKFRQKGFIEAGIEDPLLFK